MVRRRVVITGAGSYLGQAVVGELAQHDDVTIAALSSPRGSDTPPDGVRVWPVDLTHPLSPDLQAVIDEADTILHLAWLRGANESQVMGANEAMLEQLGSDNLARLTFTSTVAAGPAAPSVYGRCKQRVADRIEAAGGRVLVLGGIVAEPPGSSYAELCRTVAGSRFAVRFAPPVTPGKVIIYLIILLFLLILTE